MGSDQRVLDFEAVLAMVRRLVHGFSRVGSEHNAKTDPAKSIRARRAARNLSC